MLLLVGIQGELQVLGLGEAIAGSFRGEAKGCELVWVEVGVTCIVMEDH